MYNDKMKNPLLVFLSLLTLSTLLYFYKFPQMAAFDADQDYYALQYVEIFQKGKPTLLGIEASVGGVFVAPLYTYFTSLVYAVSAGNPLGVFLVTIIIASLQGSLTYLLFFRLTGQKTGVIAGLLVIFSHALWLKAFAPSVIGLMYLSGLFFFYYLATLPKNPKNILVLAFICGISLSLHISVFAFIPITIIYLLWKKPRNIKAKNYVLAALIFLLLASPLALFDIRHNLYLTQNLVTFFTKSTQNSDVNYIDNASRVFKSIFNTFAAFLIPQAFLAKLLIIFTIPYLLIKFRRDANTTTAVFIIGTSFLMFTFYLGRFSDYYFYFLLAPFLFIITSALSALFSTQNLRIASVGLITIILILNFQAIQKTFNPYNYFTKQEAVGYIKSQVGESKTKIHFDTNPGQGVGFNYLFILNGLNLSDSPQNTYQISIKNIQPKSGKMFGQKGADAIRVIKLNLKTDPR